MYQIRNSTGEFDGIESLERHILQKCKEHKEEKRAFAFALIVYDFYNPHINKILEDDKYFNALDYLSGKTLTIFYVNSDYVNHQSNVAQQSNQIRLELSVEKVNGISNLSPKFLGEKLINSEYLPSPSIIFFNTSDYNITDYTIAKLRENEIEKGFNELLKIVGIAVDSLKNVQEDYRKNEKEVFNLLKQSINGSEFWKNTKAGYDKMMKIKDFLLFWKV